MQELLLRLEKELQVDYRDDRIGSDRTDCMHFHEGYELVLGVRSENRCFLHDTGYAFSDRTLIFIPARLVHIIKYRPDTPYSRYVVNFSEAFIQKTLAALGCPGLLAELSSRNCLCVQLSPQQYFAVHGLFHALHTAYRRADGLPEARGYLSLLLLEAARLLPLGPSHPAAEMSAAHRLARGVARYLDENYAKEIVLEELAAQFYVSKYYLCHSFHEATGSGVVDYLQCRRILEAQKLLMQGCEAHRAAMQCGFHTMQHFYRVFKRVTGTSPGVYRLPTEE